MFFGWCKVLSNESILEYLGTSGVSSNADKYTSYKFASYYDLVFNGISNISYFLKADDISSEKRNSARIPGLVVSCIGDLMIREPKDSSELFSKVISFLEFTRNYEQNPEFKKWFEYLEDLLKNITISKTDGRWNRLIIFYTNLSVFINYLDRNSQTFQAPKSILSRYFFPRLSDMQGQKKNYLLIQSRTAGNIHPKVKEELHKQLKSLDYNIAYQT